MIAILDYGSGNIRSAERAFARTGAKVLVTSDHKLIAGADALVVPGVGAFGACMSGLRSVHGDQIITQHLAARKPILGICVGMQIFFDSGSENLSTNTQRENQLHQGLGILPGVVAKLSHPRLPHMGWNTVQPSSESSLFRGIENERFYFVHSYGVLDTEGSLTGVTYSNYGERFVAAYESQLISATQFHPEKSGDAGLQLIKNWTTLI